MEIYSEKHHRIKTKPSELRNHRDLAGIQFSDIIIQIHPLTGSCLIIHLLCSERNRLVIDKPKSVTP